MRTIRNLVARINDHCDKLELYHARKLIEENKQVFSDSRVYMQLNANARTLYKHIIKDGEGKKESQLNRLELLKINDINRYCKEFDISMLKRALRDSVDLIQRPEAQRMLNSDAVYVLEKMGVILGAGMNMKESN